MGSSGDGAREVGDGIGLVGGPWWRLLLLSIRGTSLGLSVCVIDLDVVSVHVTKR